MRNNKVFYSFVITGLFSGFLIAMFLSGKIIDIPKGTHEGGVIGVTGVGIIIVMTVLLNVFIFKIFNKDN